MTSAPLRQYNAFLSYSHSPDQLRIASALQDALHSFAKPFWKFRVTRIYRDVSNLSASPDLWGSIVAALDDSEYFLLFASEEAARSRWVQKEFEHWAATRGMDRILIVQSGGELVWDPVRECYDAQRTTALPPAALPAIRKEPRHVDLRWMLGSDQRLTTRDPRFVDAVATISATLRGVSKEKIYSVEIRQRRTTRLIIGATASLVGAVGAVAFAQYRVAVEHASVALSRQLAVQAASVANRSSGDSGPGRAFALLLAVEAYRASPTFEAHRSLAQHVYRQPLDARLFAPPGLNPFSGDSHALSGDGRYLATWAGRNLQIFEVANGRKIGFAQQMTRSIADCVLDVTGRRGVVFLYNPYDPMERTPHKEEVLLQLWDLRAGRQLGRDLVLPGTLSREAVAIAESANLVALQSRRGFAIIDVESGRIDERAANAFTARATALAFNRSGDLVMVGLADGAVYGWEVGAARVSYGPIKHGEAPIDSLTLNDDSGSVVAISEGVASVLHDGARSSVQHEIGKQAGVGTVRAARFIPATDLLALWDGSELAGFDLSARSMKPLALNFKPPARRSGIAASAEGVTVSASLGEGILVWRADLDAGTLLPGPRRHWVGHDRVSEFYDREGRILFASTPDGLRAHMRCDSSINGRQCSRAFYLTRKTSSDAEMLESRHLAVDIHSAALSLDGKWMAAGDDNGDVTIWNVSARSEHPVLRKHQPLEVAPGESSGTQAMSRSAVSALAFSPDGRTLYVAGENEVQAIETATQRQIDGPVSVRSRPSALATADDELLLVADSGVNHEILVLERAPRFTQSFALAGHTAQVMSIAGAARTPLAASSSDSEIIIWDLRERQELLRLPVEGQAPVELAFIDEERSLEYRDGRGVHSTPIGAEVLMRMACATANRNMTIDEWRLAFGEQPYRKICEDLPVHRSLVTSGYVEFEQGRDADGTAIMMHAARLDGDVTRGEALRGSAAHLAGAIAAADRGDLDAVQAHLTAAKQLDPEHMWDPGEKSQRMTAQHLAAALWRVADSGDVVGSQALARLVDSPAMRYRDINHSINVEWEIINRAESAITERVMRSVDDAQFDSAYVLVDAWAQAHATYENKEQNSDLGVPGMPRELPATQQTSKTSIVERLIQRSMEEGQRLSCSEADAKMVLPAVTRRLLKASSSRDSQELEFRFRRNVASCLVARAEHPAVENLVDVRSLLERAKRWNPDVFAENLGEKALSIQMSALRFAAKRIGPSRLESLDAASALLKQAVGINSNWASDGVLAAFKRDVDIGIRFHEALRARDAAAVLREWRLAKSGASPKFLKVLEWAIGDAVVRVTSRSDVLVTIKFGAALTRDPDAPAGLDEHVVRLCARMFGRQWIREALAACDAAVDTTNRRNGDALLSRAVTKLLAHDPVGARQDLQDIIYLEQDLFRILRHREMADKLLAQIDSGRDAVTAEFLKEIVDLVNGRFCYDLDDLPCRRSRETAPA